MFSKFDINYKENLFEELSKSTKFEKLGKGHYGAVFSRYTQKCSSRKSKAFPSRTFGLVI